MSIYGCLCFMPYKNYPLKNETKIVSFCFAVDMPSAILKSLFQNETWGLSQTSAQAPAPCAEVHAIRAAPKCSLKAELCTQCLESESKPEPEPKPRFEKCPWSVVLFNRPERKEASTMQYGTQGPLHLFILYKAGGAQVVIIFWKSETLMENRCNPG